MQPGHINVQSLTAIIGNDPKVLLGLLEDILKGSERTFELLNTNYSVQNWNSLRGNAHFLKSNFRYLGNQKLMNIMKSIEIFAPDESKRAEIPTLVSQFNTEYPLVIDDIKNYINYLKNQL